MAALAETMTDGGSSNEETMVRLALESLAVTARLGR